MHIRRGQRGCQGNFREREDWTRGPGPGRSVAGDTPAGAGTVADRPVRPGSKERGRMPAEAGEPGGGLVAPPEGRGGGESYARSPARWSRSLPARPSGHARTSTSKECLSYCPCRERYHAAGHARWGSAGLVVQRRRVRWYSHSPWSCRRPEALGAPPADGRSADAEPGGDLLAGEAMARSAQARSLESGPTDDCRRHRQHWCGGRAVGGGW
jgi:hypothetical protein